MNGLEKILGTIKDESDRLSEDIIKKAESEAEKEYKNAVAAAQNEADKAVATAKHKAKIIVETAESGAQSLVNREVLSAKADAVEEFIKTETDKWAQLETDKYFALILGLITKYAEDKSGELIMSADDIDRMPKGFMEKVNSILPTGGALQPQKGNIKGGGFILKYGNIEDNCTFSALVDEKMYEIKDRLFSAIEKSV